MAKTEKENAFVNPFAAGVSYEDFISALDGTSVAEYLKGKQKSEGEDFTDADVAWLESELKSHKSHQANKAANLARAAKEHAELVKENNK